MKRKQSAGSSKIVTWIIVGIFYLMSLIWLFDGAVSLIRLSLCDDTIISGSLKKGDFVTVNNYSYGGTILAMEHRVNYVFKRGTTYYTAVYPVDYDCIVVVVSSKRNSERCLSDPNYLPAGKIVIPDARIINKVPELVDYINNGGSVFFVDTEIAVNSVVRVIAGSSLLLCLLYLTLLRCCSLTNFKELTQNMKRTSDSVAYHVYEEKNGPIYRFLTSRICFWIFFILLVGLLLLMFFGGGILFRSTEIIMP